MYSRIGAGIVSVFVASSMSGQVVYDFDHLQLGSLGGQDGWVAGNGGAPVVVESGTGLGARGTFKVAARSADSGFQFDSEFDGQHLILSFDLHYQATGGNISNQVYFYDDENGDHDFDAGEGVFGFGLARNTTSIPSLRLQFVGEDALNVDVSDLVDFGDQLRLEAEVMQDQSGEMSVIMRMEHVTDGTGMQTLGQGVTFPEATTKQLSDVNTVQIRFDSGNSVIDDIRVERIPTPCEIADTNADGQTTPADFTFWVGCYSLGLDFPGCETGDQNGDGVLTPADFTTWINNYNSCDE